MSHSQHKGYGDWAVHEDNLAIDVSLQSTRRSPRQVENAVALESLDNHLKVEVSSYQNLGINGCGPGMASCQGLSERKNKTADGSHFGRSLATCCKVAGLPSMP